MNKVIWKRADSHGYKRLASPCGRILICEIYIRIRRKAGWGNRAGYRTRRCWNARVDGKLLCDFNKSDFFGLLREAKSASLYALQSANG